MTVTDDLKQYLQEARSWVAAEAQINSAITRVREDQFVHEDLVIETFRPVIQVAEDHVLRLEGYEPYTPQLSTAHQQYIKAWRAHPLALSTVVEAAEKKNYVQLAAARDQLLAAQSAVRDALGGLAMLMDEAGLRAQPTPPLDKQAQTEEPVAAP
jgi:hypothetical protein